MKIKICGITNIEDAKLAVEYGVDALGFVFYNKSKRFVATQKAKEIIEALPPFVNKVGVFVNEDLNIVNAICKEVKLTHVQLHGNETPEYISKIHYPVIKSFGIDENFDFEILHKFKCDFLFDVKDEIDFGGTGKKFNWDLIPLDLRKKIILAGGINIENIDYIFNHIKPYAIDLSSALEKSYGKKDKDKVIELLNRMKKLNGCYE